MIHTEIYTSIKQGFQAYPWIGHQYQIRGIVAQHARYRRTLYFIQTSCFDLLSSVGLCNSCLAWWWRCAGRRWRPRRRGGAWRRQGVEGAGVQADGKAQLSDTHVARLSEERQGLEDRGEINDGTARIGSQAIALRNTERAAVVLYVGHRRRTHGQQDQHDA